MLTTYTTLDSFQYPSITVCISRNTNGIDQINEMTIFPREPRNDLGQGISYFQMSNGSYEKHKINFSGSSDVNTELLSYHLIVFGLYIGSCITFTSPSRVSAGSQHNVSFSVLVDLQFIVISTLFSA